ncbi:DNA repair protein RecO [Ferruginibacter albus]|uniref:DNA repair protein RecO n=1 Tax=Ferruginibacter albus TaxID=2875540 RepID=UPI001CC4D9AB|nr:DNA repair protein RecO [Ferruginibacter albus]UAY51914.1 DNA repair protein RecO [Ferruginibacter albus]
MTHKTKGIVLRTIKYGETSLVVTLFTELFGIQTYMVNGVRTSKKSGGKANYFQPAAILDLVVYHNELKTMQRIKEVRWAFIYTNIFSHVIKNSITLYMVELLHKCLKQPESNTDLFLFFEDALLQLDIADKTVTANFTLYISLHLAHFFGFRINDDYSETQNILDLQEGSFVSQRPTHPYFIEDEPAHLTSQLLKVMQPQELENFKLNQDIRRRLLLCYQDYYALHIQDFGKMKTLVTLHEVLS